MLLALALGVAASCTPASRSAYQVSSAPLFAVRNPVVTYTYGTYDELLQATQDAHDYCGALDSVPVSGYPALGTDGRQFITFECTRPAPHAPGVMPIPIP